MTRFFITLLLSAVAAELIVRYTGLVTPTLPATIANGILLLGTVLLYRMMSRARDPQTFTQVYLISIVAKIFLACLLIVALIFLDRPHARANVIFLFGMYVLYTAIEVFFLVRLRRAHNGAKKNQKISF